MAFSPDAKRMDFPLDFSPQARSRIIATEIEASRAVAEPGNLSWTRVPGLIDDDRTALIFRYIRTVFAAFAREACELGRKPGGWMAHVIEREVREGLRRITINAAYKYDSTVFRLPELISHSTGELVPKARSFFESTEEWRTYETDLLEIIRLRSEDHPSDVSPCRIESESQAPTAPVPGRGPKVFISYSWDSDSHKAWVETFARRLRNEGGLQTVLDTWHLRPGARSPQFMETSIRESPNTLVICTPQYKDRSDNRLGGAGYEGHIITGEILSDEAKEKFIPILREGTWQTAVPTWLKGVFGFDFRDGRNCEDDYRTLVRHLHGDVPVAPPIGERPSYVKALPGVGSTAVTVGPAPSATPYEQPLKIVDFGYIPGRTPLDSGWILGEGDLTETTFAKPADAPGDGYIKIDTHGKRFAIDRLVEDHGVAAHCKTITFSSTLPAGALIYAGVWLNDSNGHRVSSGKDGGMFWLAYQMGDATRAPHRDERYRNEVVIWISGSQVSSGWWKFSLRLPEDVRRAYPGLVYSELGRIRLRNSLSISPIWLG